mmetsp:Transcript_5477/g.15250  ORF Transcript_5477/g.15250 Transcript_5477/m.15250 type:complete len:205 (+) Transcript_5477:1906-2520(+)
MTMRTAPRRIPPAFRPLPYPPIDSSSLFMLCPRPRARPISASVIPLPSSRTSIVASGNLSLSRKSMASPTSTLINEALESRLLSMISARAPSTHVCEVELVDRKLGETFSAPTELLASSETVFLAAQELASSKARFKPHTPVRGGLLSRMLGTCRSCLLWSSFLRFAAATPLADCAPGGRRTCASSAAPALSRRLPEGPPSALP